MMVWEHVPDFHLCKAYWCPKEGKASGRPLGDLSINTDETAKAATDYYREIRHPTTEDIARMVHEFWLRQQDLRLLKMDLKGAYAPLSFRPGDAGLFAMLLYFQLAGIFGWAGTPAAFQVVTRAMSWELRHVLLRRTLMYVDDIVGIGFVDEIAADIAKTRDICACLLGSGSVSDEKTEFRRRLDIIVNTLCLDAEQVFIVPKNFLKALHGFATTDVNARVNLRTAQRLASWGTRYAKICRVMRPFCSYLNTWGRTDAHARTGQG